MAFCNYCGFENGNAPICQRCGAPVQRYAAPPPMQPPQPPKRSRAPYIVLFSLLGVLLILGGVACFMIFKSEGPRPRVFDYSCADFTEELNRVASGNSADSLKLDPKKWVTNGTDDGFVYRESDFTIDVSTGSTDDRAAKIRALRVGPAGNERAAKIAALSVLTIDDSQTAESVERDLEDLRNRKTEKLEYNNVEVGYDGEEDRFNVTPGEPNEQPTETKKPDSERVAETKPENAEPVYSDFVAGRTMIIAGGKYIFSDGKTICFRSEITGADTKIIDARNNGQLLSDGTTLFYVEIGEKESEGGKICSVKLDGSEQKTLVTYTDATSYLVHRYGDCLYYLLQGAKQVDDEHFYKFDFYDNSETELKNVVYSPYYCLVSKNEMYTCVKPHAIMEADSFPVSKFNFDTEEVTEVLADAQVFRESGILTTETPCFVSGKAKVTGGRAVYKDHYIYTVEDGKLKKSAELPEADKVMQANPTGGTALLGLDSDDYVSKTLRAFDKKTGEVRELATLGNRDSSVNAVVDLARPGDIYVTVTVRMTEAQKSFLKELYRFTGDRLEPCDIGDEETEVSFTGLIVADGHFLGADFKPHPVKAAKAEETSAPVTKSGGSAADDYSKYIGSWKKQGESGELKKVDITKTEGDSLSFKVTHVYPNARRIVETEEITGKVREGKVEFTYRDSFNNTGSGTLELKDGCVHIKTTSNGESPLAWLILDDDLRDRG